MLISKLSILRELSNAKISHERWVKRAEHLVEGLPISEDFIPTEPTSCEFGKWLYSDIGKELRFQQAYKDTIERIESYHDMIHDAYKSIYKCFFVIPKQRSLLYKIITLNNKQPTKKELEIAHHKLELLKGYSSSMIDLLDKLEKLIKQS